MTTFETLPGQETIVPLGPLPAAPRVLRPLERLGRGLLLSSIGKMRHGQITIHDGAERHSSPQPVGEIDCPRCIVEVHDPRVYAAAAFGGGIALAEAYMDGLWDTDDLPGLIETLTVNYSALSAIEGPGARVLQFFERLRYWAGRNSRSGSRRNIHAHYDIGNDLFALFLDPSMTYSAAIFENGADSLEAAQREKLDRACRKLDLRPTDHLLEIGTGWGSMAIHAAHHYGCRVTTTTISEEQCALASARVRGAGLAGRVTVLRQDYRDLRGRYDKLLSIEMIEAVGAENLGRFFERCSSLLKPAGAMLIQGIVIRDQFFDRAARRVDFLKKYIFPGSCLVSSHAMLDAAKRRSDLRLWHSEDIGPHYATTLSKWRERFNHHLGEVRALGFDERFIRMWNYYLAYCEGAFRARHVGAVQMLLTKPMCRMGTASPRAAEPAPPPGAAVD